MPIPDWPACRALAAAIIIRAIGDWRRYSNETEPENNGGGTRATVFALARACGHDTPRGELLEFFESEWFDFLWEYVGTGEKEKAMEAIGVTSASPPESSLQVLPPP